MEAKTLLLSAALVFCGIAATAQSLSSPESVEYDSANDRYLISNTGSNQILAQDQAGNLSVFTSTPGSPYGLEVVGNTVYVCIAPGTIKGYDLTSTAEVFSTNTGATFANGITSDGTDLYVSDFSGSQILKVEVATQTTSVVVANTNGTPNGVLYLAANNSLFVVFWGSNAPWKGYDIATGNELYSVPTTLTNIDGLAIDCNNRLYVSSWSPDAITRFNFGSPVPTTMPWTVSNPADLDYDAVNERVCIPNTSANSVTLEEVTDCSVSIQEFNQKLEIKLFPVPATDELTIRTHELETQAYTLFDLQGRILLSGTVRDNDQIDIRDLAEGQYVIQMNDGRTKLFAKN